MSIRTRVIALVGISVVSLSLLIVVGWRGMVAMRQGMDGLVQTKLLPLVNEDVEGLMRLQASIELLLNADRDAYQSTLAQKNALAAPAKLVELDEGRRENYAQVVQRAEKAAAAFDEEAGPLYAEMKELYADWGRKSDRVMELLAAGDVVGAQALDTGESHEVFEAMRDRIDQLQGLLEKRIETTVAQIDQKRQDAEASAAESARQARMTMALFVGIAGGAVAVLVIVGVLITRSIAKAIRAIVLRLRDISQGEGDLTQRVDESRKDELGELGRWFNLFVKKTHDLLVEIASNTREVAAASTEIAASSEEIAAGMKEQTDQMSQITSAVGQMSSSVAEVAGKADEASRASRQAGAVANQGGETVRHTIQDMQTISEAVGASATAVRELGKRGEQIGQIISVINDIADQTNLLALNAAIEAARAGEHGRGFAVVADEVRKLADRTQKATAEVGESIRAIQNETAAAVERMSTGTDRVTRGVERASGAGASLDEIVKAAQTVSTMVEQIAGAAQQQASASEEVTRSIESIEAVTRQSQEGTQQAAAAAAELSRRAERLQVLVGQFKLAS